MTGKGKHIQILGVGTAEELRLRTVAALADPSAADSAGDAPSTNGPDAPWCGDCGGDVRWFAVEQVLMSEPSDRERFAAAVATMRECLGSAGRVMFKQCTVCGVNMLVGFGHVDPATGRGVDPTTGKP